MFKSLITVSAVLAMAAPAFASKARLASLQNAANVTDTYSIFDNPAKSYLLGDFATLEMGSTTTAQTGVNTPENVVTNGNTAGITLYNPDAEGGFVKSYGDSKIGFYIGKKSPFTARMRSLMGFEGQVNPIEIMYGFQAADLKWGASLNYSKAEPKTAAAGKQKEDAMGVRLGVIGSNWDAGLTLGLGSNATGTAGNNIGIATVGANSDSTYKGTTGFKVTGGYWFNTMYVYGTYYQDGAKLEGLALTAPVATTATVTIEQSQYEVGVIDTMKADGMNFFYGVSYIGFKSKAKDITPGALDTTVQNAFTQEQTQLPFILGVEADAASWLTLRASVKQNVLLGSTKVNAGETSSNIANNTTVAAGAGMKFNKFTLDTTLAAGSVPGSAGTGEINANNLMANASLTYMF